MINIINNPGTETILSATSDCGRVVYEPELNGRVAIDGRVACRGHYGNAQGYYSDCPVDAVEWERACTLIKTVDQHNAAARASARDADFERQVARAEAEDAALERVGYYL